MDEQFLSLPGAAGPVQIGERLQAILVADRARERARARRNTLVTLLGVVGLPLWLANVWPGQVPGEMRSFVAAAWALTFATVLVALAWEGMASVRRARQVARLGPLPVLRGANRASARTSARTSPRTSTQACAAPAEEED